MDVDSSFGRSETDFVDKLGPLVILCFFFKKSVCAFFKYQELKSVYFSIIRTF